MPLYGYRTIDDYGKEHRGQLEAENEEELAKQLGDKGLYLLEAEVPSSFPLPSQKSKKIEAKRKYKYKVFKHPLSGDIEYVKQGFRWIVLLFGPFWYLWQGVIWRGLFWLLLAVVTFWIVCFFLAPFFAAKDLEKHLLRSGYRFIGYANSKDGPISTET